MGVIIPRAHTAYSRESDIAPKESVCLRIRGVGEVKGRRGAFRAQMPLPALNSFHTPVLNDLFVEATAAVIGDVYVKSQGTVLVLVLSIPRYFTTLLDAMSVLQLVLSYDNR